MRAPPAKRRLGLLGSRDVDLDPAQLALDRLLPRHVALAVDLQLLDRLPVRGDHLAADDLQEAHRDLDARRVALEQAPPRASCRGRRRAAGAVGAAG